MDPLKLRRRDEDYFKVIAECKKTNLGNVPDSAIWSISVNLSILERRGILTEENFIAKDPQKELYLA
jgi:hypothetical protein